MPTIQSERPDMSLDSLFSGFLEQIKQSMPATEDIPGVVFDKEMFLEFHKSVMGLYESARKLEEAIPLLQAFYDYSNPPSRMKNYDAYMDALQRTRKLLREWGGES